MDLKIKSAVFHAASQNYYATVEIRFADDRSAWLNSDMKRTLLKQGIVYLGFEDLPAVYYKDQSSKIELAECTKNENVAAVARKFASFLDGDLQLNEGDSLL